MKNEVSEQVKAEIWTETGLDSITGYWGSYTIFAVNNPLAPLRNHVAASTNAEYTTRLEQKTGPEVHSSGPCSFGPPIAGFYRFVKSRPAKFTGRNPPKIEPQKAQSHGIHPQ